MGRYLLNRGLAGLVTLVLFASLAFFLVQIIVPADFTVQFSIGMNRAEREKLQDELGLNLPLWQQYLNWMRDFFSGKLGTSFYGYPVLDVLQAALPLSLLIFLPGTGLAYWIGMQLGKFAGWSRRRATGNAVTLGGLALFTTFPPWLAWLVAYFLGRRLGMLRGGFFSTLGLDDLNRGLWASIELRPDQVAARMLLTLALMTAALAVVHSVLRRRQRSLSPVLFVLALAALCYPIWLAWGFGPQALDLLTLAILPMLTYTLLSFGETLLIMRTGMQESRTQEYITVARAKGLPEEQIRDRHAARNAILPVVSRLIISLPYLLTGIVIIEDVLEWPGLGTALFNSLYQQDMPMVMAMFLMVGGFSLAARLLLEALLAMLDLRLRVSGQAEYLA